MCLWFYRLRCIIHGFGDASFRIMPLCVSAHQISEWNGVKSVNIGCEFWVEYIVDVDTFSVELHACSF